MQDSSYSFQHYSPARGKHDHYSAIGMLRGRNRALEVSGRNKRLFGSSRVLPPFSHAGRFLVISITDL